MPALKNTTLERWLRALLEKNRDNKNENEFYSLPENALVAIPFKRDDEYNSYSKQILRYTAQFEKIFNHFVFTDMKLFDSINDVQFKRTFIHNFLNKSLRFETTDAWRNRLLGVFLETEDALNFIYTNKQKLLAGGSIVTTDSDALALNFRDDIKASRTKTNSLIATLPQNEINMNLANDTLDYADNNTIALNSSSDSNSQRDSDSNSAHQVVDTNNFNAQYITQYNSLLADIFLRYETELFRSWF
jgi:hypothetical protein